MELEQVNKELKEKAVDIKGKDYVLVKDRILAFNDLYPNGAIKTELLSDPSSDTIVMKASVYPTALDSVALLPLKEEYGVFTGHSQAVVGEGYINKTAALENAETSAVGRALAMMGIGVIESIASADEVKKATHKPAF